MGAGIPDVAAKASQSGMVPAEAVLSASAPPAGSQKAGETAQTRQASPRLQMERVARKVKFSSESVKPLGRGGREPLAWGCGDAPPPRDPEADAAHERMWKRKNNSAEHTL